MPYRRSTFPYSSCIAVDGVVVLMVFNYLFFADCGFVVRKRWLVVFMCKFGLLNSSNNDKDKVNINIYVKFCTSTNDSRCLTTRKI
jgi:hypothetical protein